LLVADHDHLDGGMDVGMQVQRHVVLAGVAQRTFAQDHFALVHDMAGGGQRFGDVARAYRTEQLAFRAGMRGNGDRRIGKLDLACLGISQQGVGLGFVFGTTLLERRQVGRIDAHGLALGQEEIAAITRLHHDLVAERAETADFLQKNEFHDGSCSLAPVWPGAARGRLSEGVAPSPRRGEGWGEGPGLAMVPVEANFDEACREHRPLICPAGIFSPEGRRNGRSDVVVVGVRQQREEARALDRGRQLTLVAGLGAGDAARHDLAVLGDVLAQGVEILVVDLLHVFGSEAAEFAAAEKLGHGLGSYQSSLSRSLSSRPWPRPSPSPSSSRRRVDLASSFSFDFRMKDGSTSASSRRITRWRSTASLKRKPDSSSFSAFWLTSMLSST